MSDPWGGVGGWNDPRYTWTPDSNIDPYHWPPGTVTAAAAPTSPSAPAPPPRPSPAAVPHAPPAAPAGTPEQRDANAIIQQYLTMFGLGELSDWAWQQIVDGATQAQIELQLYDPTSVPGKVVDRLYPELKVRREANLAPMSISAVVQYRDQATQMLRAAGLPKTFYDQPEDLARFVGQDVSLAELQQRITEGVQAATTAPAETRAELHRLYGVDLGHLTAYYLDPDQALPILQRRQAAAELSGAGVRSGFGGLAQSEAERLAALGLSPDAAAQGFGQLVQSHELFGALPGQSGEQISREEQLAGVFGGDAGVQEKIRRTAAARRAMFGEGGGFAAGQKGLAGLGSAAS